jgi:hypothetical protein
MSMRILRVKHHPTGQVFIIDPQAGRVFGVNEDKIAISMRDEVTAARGGVRADDLLAAASGFEKLWKWPEPGTRFPQHGEFPDAWFASTAGRLNQTGLQGDLEFRGYIDRVEAAALASGGAVSTERTALERHLCALDYRLQGVLGPMDLYRAFIGSRLSPLQAAKKALGAWLIFGRGRPVSIAAIAQRRPAARSGGFDDDGQVDPEIILQYRRLFDSAANDEIDQSRLQQFNERNFQNGFVSKEQWKSFFASCRDLNGRPTVTFSQLLGTFEGHFEYVAASRADARGMRPLDRVMPG